MADNCNAVPQCGQDGSTLSIHTRKITDSCRDKDCIEGLRVYLTKGSQAILDTAACTKVRCAELIYTYIDVEPVAFDRNHYCVNVTYYYRVLADATVGGCRPTTLYGLAVFSKQAVLCGEESTAHIFTSRTVLDGQDGCSVYSTNLPTAVVEVLDPMVLCSQVKDVRECGCCHDTCQEQIPQCVCKLFDEQLVLDGESRRLYVTLGQFSVIRLERDVQLVVPVVSYSMPTKVCCENPGCGLLRESRLRRGPLRDVLPDSLPHGAVQSHQLRPKGGGLRLLLRLHHHQKLRLRPVIKRGCPLGSPFWFICDLLSSWYRRDRQCRYFPAVPSGWPLRSQCKSGGACPVPEAPPGSGALPWLCEPAR